jgi:uncharacterized repeat protein (TIGR03803 family)
MKLTSLTRSLVMMAALSVLSLSLFQTAKAQTADVAAKETVLYNFCLDGGTSCTDGQGPEGPLASGPGAYYGVSGGGGTGGEGTVFGLSPEPSSGGCGSGVNTGNGWCEFVLYSFCSVKNCTDGNGPIGNVSYLNSKFGKPGNIYGTTYYGGAQNLGTVFEISSKPTIGNCPSGSNQNGGWCETVLYSFCSYDLGISCSDGYHPGGNLVEDSKGNLYGVVVGEAQNGVGGVFELSPDQQGGYDEGIIYSDNFIQIGLAIDSNDNLYGTDTNFGTGQANVFKISLSQLGDPQTNIYTFSGSQGFPTGVTVDSTGNLYGATYTGGSTGLGTVWKLSPVTTGKKAGTYTKKILHTFTAAKGGENPETPVTLDSSGNIYGTAIGGNTACPGGCGTLFELSPDGDIYKYKVVWTFTGTDGDGPSLPILNSAGDLLGVTYSGGVNNSGTMFQITP